MDLVQIASSYGLELKKSGALYICLCPFHNDVKTPNMVIYPESNTFHCYSCGENGNVLWFISKMEHKPLFEVKKQYAGTVTKYKIGKIKNCGVNDYKDELLTQIATITRKFLYENPAKLSQVLCVLSDIDAKVFKQEILDRNIKIELVDTLMLHLKKIKEDTSVC